jgi:DNA-binding NtrC family response regulator
VKDSDIARGGTLHDSTDRPASLAPLRLIYIGSPEDDFAEAGRMFSLADVTRVEFGRGRARSLTAVTRSDVLELSLPFPWVSSRHARLDLTGSAPLLVDTGSRNGTLVEGRSIDRRPVGNAEVFEIGRSFWLVRSHRDAVERTSSIDPNGVASPAHAEMLQSLERLAPTRVPILLVGETGSGKDYLADAIHRATGRDGPMVRVNLLASPPDERLFGSGGATGLIERARGGTLLLDDVGDLPNRDQAQLLSALLSQIPSGAGDLALPPDGVRLLSSSTRDLRTMVTTELFRPDLYARLAGYECHVTPLRDRREDEGLLVRAIARDDDGSAVHVAIDVFRSILRHSWPFNLRELGHCLRAAMALSNLERGVSLDAWARASWRSSDVPTPARIASVRQALVRELAEHRGDTRKVAASLKCDVEDIERWLERFALEPAAFSAR